MNWGGLARRVLWPAGIALAAAGLGFIPLMGLPGAVVAEVTAAVFGFSDKLAAMGPSVWGLAIFVTWIAAAGIPLGCWALWTFQPQSGLAAAACAGLAGYAIAGAIATFLITPAEWNPGKAQTRLDGDAAAAGPLTPAAAR